VSRSVCVIGGGLAGGIIASTLARKGFDVRLVEQGDAPAPLTSGSEIWEDMPVKAPFTRGSGLGGTSNFWHGGLTLLDRSDIEGVPGHKDRFPTPIGYDVLREYYGQAIGLLRGEGAFSLSDIESPPPGRVDGFGETGPAFRFKALLYPGRPFSTRPLIERAQRLDGLKVSKNVEIRRFVNDAPRRVRSAQGVDRATGAPVSFDADAFVLSAGGLGSPKVLIGSAESCPPISRLPVGRFIIDHPTGFVFKAKLRRRMKLTQLFGVPGEGYRTHYGFVLNEDHLAAADFRNHILYLRPATSMKDPAAYDFLKRKLVTMRGRALGVFDAAYLIRHTDLLFDALNYRYGLSASTRYVSGLVFAEQLADDYARVSSSGGGRFAVKWRVSEDDCRSLTKFLRLFQESFSDQFEAFRLFDGVSARLDSAGHHSGGCRMAPDSSRGVVDAHLRVFGIDNLFVADGSVLPYSGHANTGLTIAALALKCCDTITAA
jgi:choline dehydrogenase-like flavoprotein